MPQPYQLTDVSTVVLRIADNTHIPLADGNRDYREYQAWLDAGNTPDPAPPPTRPEEAAAYLAGGLTVNFPNSQPGLGTYAVVGAGASNLNSIMTLYNQSGRFPNNQTSVAIFDVTHSLHNFTKQTFVPFGNAVSDFVHNAHLYAEGEAISLPPNSVSLTALAEEILAPEEIAARLEAQEARIAALEARLAALALP